MTTLNRSLILAAIGLPLFGLAACGEDQSASSPPRPEPPAVVEQGEDTPPQSDEPMDQLRQGAEALRQGAESLAGEARDRAQEVLNDPGPLLEQAGEIAGQIGESVSEIVRQAADDIETAAKLLEERIAEMQGGERLIVDDTAAQLSPAEMLNADTRAAGRAVQAGVGPAYVGVWADRAASCARIDQEAVEMFAVITPTTIRRHESVCNIEEQPLVDGEVTLPASCMAEGETEDRMITLAMPDQGTLRITYDGMDTGAELVRCHLPG